MTRTGKWLSVLWLAIGAASLNTTSASGRSADPFAAQGGIWTVTSTCALDGIGFIDGGMAMIYYRGDRDSPSGAAFYEFEGSAFSMTDLSANVANPAYTSFLLGGALRPDGTLHVVHGYVEKGSTVRKREECDLKLEAG